MKKNIYAAAALFLCIVGGVLLGNMLARRANLRNNATSLSTLVKTLGKGNRVDELLRLIDTQYVDTVDMQRLTDDAMFAVMEDLDPHSVYIPADELEMVNSELEGSFSGIGVQFNIQNDTIMVVAVISGGPAEKVGVLAGDPTDLPSSVPALIVCFFMLAALITSMFGWLTLFPLSYLYGSVRTRKKEKMAFEEEERRLTGMQ